MKVAIIGAKSFIGRHLVVELNSIEGLELHLFSTTIGKVIGIGVDSMESFYKNTAETYDNIDIVYYLASSSIPSSSWENPIVEVDSNLIPFLQFLNECVNRNVKKIVFISSAGTVYGSSLLPLSEVSPKKPFSPYGINKLTMEYYLNYYKLRYNINYDVFRVSNVYGEGQNTSKGLGVLNTLLENLAFNRVTSIYGDGENIRNYIYVKDVVKVLVKSTQKVNKSGVYNLSSESNMSLKELIIAVEKVLKVKCKIEYRPNRGSDNPFIILDNKKLLKTFPDIRFTEVSEGIKSTYGFILKNND